MTRTARPLAIIGLLSLLTLGTLLLLALFPTLLRAPIALLVTKDEPTNADLIVVLAGNPVTRSLAARDLYSRGFSHKVLVSPEPPNPLQAELKKLGFKREPDSTAQRILMASGVPLSAIEQLPTHAENTKDETRRVAAYAKDHAVKSILLVTSPLTSRRQCWIFNRALPNIPVSCQPTSYEQMEYNRRLVLWVINEYLKFAANTVGVS